jgi:hypothetical protein
MCLIVKLKLMKMITMDGYEADRFVPHNDIGASCLIRHSMRKFLKRHWEIEPLDTLSGKEVA